MGVPLPNQQTVKDVSRCSGAERFHPRPARQYHARLRRPNWVRLRGQERDHLCSPVAGEEDLLAISAPSEQLIIRRVLNDRLLHVSVCRDNTDVSIDRVILLPVLVRDLLSIRGDTDTPLDRPTRRNATNRSIAFDRNEFPTAGRSSERRENFVPVRPRTDLERFTVTFIQHTVVRAVEPNDADGGAATLVEDTRFDDRLATRQTARPVPPRS